MRTVLSSALALAIVCTAGPALAEPAARLEVDTSELGSIGPVLKERLVERGSQVLRDESIVLGGPQDPIVRVTITALEGEDPGFDYEIRLVTHPGEDGASWSERCALCTEAELIDAVAAELDKVAMSLRALGEEREAAEQEPPPPPIVESPPIEPRDQDRVLDTKGKVGVGLLGLGVVAVGTGVGLVLAPARPLANDPLRESYTQPPGYGVLAVGGAVLVTGAVLLGLSLRDRKRGTAQHRSGHFALRWGASLASTPTQVAPPLPATP